MTPYICRVAISHSSTRAEKRRARGAPRATHPSLSPHRCEANDVDASSPGFAEAISGGPNAPHPRGVTHTGNTSAITSAGPNTAEAVLPTDATLPGALPTILFSFGSGAPFPGPAHVSALA